MDNKYRDDLSDVPQKGELWKYEVAPYHQFKPRWSVCHTVFGKKIWRDAGSSARTEIAHVVSVSKNGIVLKFEDKTTQEFPVSSEHPDYEAGLWDKPGFPSPVFNRYTLDGAPTEECPGCHRQRDVGKKCWCCGGF